MSNSDQLEEIEVLSSIYPSEFELLPPADDSTLTNFKIHLVPSTTDGKHHVAVSLCCSLPVDYPSDSVPTISIEIEKGLSSAQTEELMVVADRVAAENIGMPSIYSIAEAVKEWLTDNNIPGQDGSMYSEMMRRIQQKEVEAKKQVDKAAITAAADSELRSEEVDLAELERIRKRQAGTQVTLESFNAWKISFDEEMRQLQLAALHRSLGGSAAVARQDLLDEALHNRPTGKQLFLMNKAGSDLDNEVEAMISAGELEVVEDVDEDDEDDEDYVDEDDIDDDDDDDDYAEDEEG